MAFNLKTNIKGERIYLFSYFHPGLFFRHYWKWMFFLCFVFASERGRRRSVSCCREVQALTTDCYCSATMREIAHRADSFINRYFVLDNTSLQLNGTCCFSHVLSLYTEFPKSYMFKFMALKILGVFWTLFWKPCSILAQTDSLCHLNWGGGDGLLTIELLESK